MEHRISFDEKSKEEVLNVILGFCNGFIETGHYIAKRLEDGGCRHEAEVFSARADGVSKLRSFILDCMGGKENEWNF